MPPDQRSIPIFPGISREIPAGPLIVPLQSAWEGEGIKRPPGSEPLARARTLRRDQTDAEKRLWSILRGGRILGAKFRRQIWIAGYIADFACLEARLIVEADGGQHAQAQAYDDARSAALAREGFRVLRFWNHQILGDPRMVADTIAAVLHPHPPTAVRRAPPSPQVGEG